MRYALAALLLIPLTAVAADAPPPAPIIPRSITVTGTAERDVVPDEAHIAVHVSALAPKLDVAKADHDGKLARVIDIAKKAGVEDAQVRALNSSIQPQYSVENSKRVFKGYQVQTMLDVTVKKIDTLGGLIEKFAGANLETGGNSDGAGLMSVNYSVGQPDKIRDEILADAIRNAHSKAESMAAVTGSKLGTVISINENNAPSFAFAQPMPMMRGMAATAVAPVTEQSIAPPPGEQQVNANVTVTFELKE